MPLQSASQFGGGPQGELGFLMGLKPPSAPFGYILETNNVFWFATLLDISMNVPQHNGITLARFTIREELPQKKIKKKKKNCHIKKKKYQFTERRVLFFFMCYSFLWTQFKMN